MHTKEYNFWKLISEYNIEIPAIQRDYAQGRMTESRVAISLVGDIANALNTEKRLNLHFVYGKIDNQHLIPLDGQQRLTTLFLLHWFLSIEFLTEDERNCLSKFTYETRPSSEDFCHKLVKEEFKYTPNQPISEQIINSRWFFLSWQNDPTISAMLNMLNHIQQEFKQPNESLFKLLIGEESPIQFHFLPLDKFKLDDKIYVKMNSRGKPLTDFENFKANFSVLFDIENKSKLDNEWLDIFWKYEKHKDKINVAEVDRKFLNFIKRTSLNFYVETIDIDKSFIDKFNIFDSYTDIYNNQYNNLDYISRIQDALTSYNDSERFFEKFINSEVDYWDRLRFYAVMRFFIQEGSVNESNLEMYEKWIRVSTNLINNTLIQSPDLFYRAIRSIKDLSFHIKNLYEYISNQENKIEAFSQKQIEEERIKARLILDNATWSSEIHKIEKHPYFSGQIGFILEFSMNESIYNLENFADYSSKLSVLFGSEFRDSKQNLFQRALLTVGDYLVPINSCITFCTFNESLREKNDNWRKLFDNKDKREFLRILLDKININSIETDLLLLINSYSLYDWKYIFIKYDSIIEYCDKYRIAKRKNDNIIALSRSSADNWRRSGELYSYALFLELKKEKLVVNYHDSSEYDAWFSVKWKDEYYYIAEGEKDYVFGFCEGYNNSDELEKMKQYVFSIIEKTNLTKHCVSNLT